MATPQNEPSYPVLETVVNWTRSRDRLCCEQILQRLTRASRLTLCESLMASVTVRCATGAGLGIRTLGVWWAKTETQHPWIAVPVLTSPTRACAVRTEGGTAGEDQLLTHRSCEDCRCHQCHCCRVHSQRTSPRPWMVTSSLAAVIAVSFYAAVTVCSAHA